MKQIWIPYWEWEDWKSGMWRKLQQHEERFYIEKAISFTGNHIIYGNAMLEVIYAWPMTMINSLTNKSINKKAFVGHCAVQFKINCPEYITRIAWGNLNDKQRELANNAALFAVNTWTKNYEDKNK